MRKFIACMVVAAFSASAHADTLKEVTTKGVIVSQPGVKVEGEMIFKPGGTFAMTYPGLSMSIPGRWRINGDKLCITFSAFTGESLGEEQCMIFPKDKKSGDSFDVTSSGGTMTTMRIK
jgi:hypothetical protein